MVAYKQLIALVGVNPFASQSNPCSKQTFAVDRDSPATGLTPRTLFVRHGIITSVLPVARSVIFDLSIVSALAQQPMQLQAHAHVSRLPPACLLQVQVSKSGVMLLAHSCCIRQASAMQRGAAVVIIMSMHTDHHHHTRRVWRV